MSLLNLVSWKEFQKNKANYFKKLFTVRIIDMSDNKTVPFYSEWTRFSQKVHQRPILWSLTPKTSFHCLVIVFAFAMSRSIHTFCACGISNNAHLCIYHLSHPCVHCRGLNMFNISFKLKSEIIVCLFGKCACLDAQMFCIDGCKCTSASALILFAYKVW